MLPTEQQLLEIDFHSTEKNTMQANGYRQLFDYKDSSK